jgi:hypothetical protein
MDVLNEFANVAVMRLSASELFYSICSKDGGIWRQNANCEMRKETRELKVFVCFFAWFQGLSKENLTRLLNFVIQELEKDVVHMGGSTNLLPIIFEKIQSIMKTFPNDVVMQDVIPSVWLDKMVAMNEKLKINPNLLFEYRNPRTTKDVRIRRYLELLRSEGCTVNFDSSLKVITVQDTVLSG